jgi:hypothetical protein
VKRASGGTATVAVARWEVSSCPRSCSQDGSGDHLETLSNALLLGICTAA